MKIVCVGRNYAAHAQELNNPLPAQPMIFLKPESALLTGNADFIHPDFSNDIHFECELVYRVGKRAKFLKKENAWECIDGLGIGIDFTARDLQEEIKKKGHPWTLAKMFDGSAPISAFLPPADFREHKNLQFELRVNGTKRQLGNSRDMIFDLETLLAYVTRYLSLEKGDLIFTGTPEGVGKVERGDRLQASLEGRELLDFYVR